MGLQQRGGLTTWSDLKPFPVGLKLVRLVDFQTAFLVLGSKCLKVNWAVAGTRKILRRMKATEYHRRCMSLEVK